MQKLVFGAIALAGVVNMGTGCIISSDDDDDGPGDGTDNSDGTGTGCDDVLGGDGACFSVLVDCPDDATTYTVYTQPTVGGAPFTDTINCGTLGAILVDAGEYDMRVEANVPGGFVYGYEALENEVATNGSITEVDFTPSVGEGFFFLSWTISDGAGPLECEDIGATGLSVLSTLVGPNDAIDDILKCHYYDGWQTGGLELGTYEVSVSLIDEGGAISDAQGFEATLAEDSELVDLGNIDFVVE